MNLFDARTDKSYIIKRVTAGGDVCRRLTDMGFTRGSRVRISGRAPFNGAVLTTLRGTLIALRRDIALCIEVEPHGV